MIFKGLESADIIASSQTIVTTGMWSGDVGQLSGSVHLDEDQITNSGIYYLDVYNEATTSETAEVQFAVSYGHINGAGSPTLQNNFESPLASRAIYSQYRNLLLDPSQTKFNFEGKDSDHIYVINVQRARMREQLDAGNWQLPLSGAMGRTFTFVDDSGQSLGTNTATSKAGRRFKVISGSIANGFVSASGEIATNYSGSGYGYVYPDLGLIVLNPQAICPLVGFYGNSAKEGISASLSAPAYTSATLVNFPGPFAPFTGSNAYSSEDSAYNHAGLVDAIHKGMTGQTIGTNEFRARSAETISSRHYFIRLRWNEFNYSNNPTFWDKTDQTIIQPDFDIDPKVFITTVGLYNVTNELLAVAKLSKPVKKSFNEEVLLRVRLDF